MIYPKLPSSTRWPRWRRPRTSRTLRQQLLAGRAELAAHLPALPIVAEVFPSDANFLLVRFHPDATAVYEYLLSRGIVVRNRTTQPGCAGTLRLTVGSPAENERALAHGTKPCAWLELCGQD
ncbi:MAG: aminotransferase class I/II-fold pyridoxal phosphate-dependent enzyme [Hymenobacter sp.]